jgi:nucleoside-diphosphate-sugar epimerase
MFLRVLERELPFSVTTARLALVFGPDQSESFLIPALIRACLEGRPFHVSRPSDRRDLIYVDDAIDAFMLMADNQPPGCHAINIASGIAPSMREVAGHIIDATGADPALVRFGDPAPESGISELLASPEKARRLLSWSATTLLREGIRQTVAVMARPQAMTAQGAV